MNESEIKKGRKKYNKLQKEKEYYLNKKKELEELKNEPKVQQYMETIKYLDRHIDKEFEEEKMKINSFKNLAVRTNDSKNILVFMGFRNERANMSIDPKLIDYAVFRDIETMKIDVVKYSDYDEFCKNNNIIFVDNCYHYHNSEYYTTKYFELRKKYLSSLIELDQEEAQELIKK